MQKLAREAKSPTYVSHMLKSYQRDRKRYQYISRECSRVARLRKSSPKRLLSLYERLRNIYLVVPYYFFSPWAINHVTAPQFEQQLRKRFPKTWQWLYRAVTTPTKLISMDRQYLQLLRYKAEGTLIKRLPQHAKRYGWLGVYSLLDRPWTGRHFLSQVRHVRDPRRAIAQKQRVLAEHRREYSRALRMLLPYPKLVHTARVLNFFAWFRTERVDMLRESLLLTQAFYHELERRMRLLPNHGPHLTYEEIVEFLKDGTRPDPRAIGPCQLFGIINDRLVLMRDEVEAKRFFARIVGNRDMRSKRSVKGTPACPGKVHGLVRIVMVPEDCKKIRKGDILVSNMTHTDYLAGMARAGAVVTDEGGISCHAAIISRELNKPCVIGTKIATEVFRDSDRVEVDANHGIVRLLKRG
ncbi:MAG: PEP-utilizing enzyme [Candidatus Kerfeldbacteria bacterium]